MPPSPACRPSTFSRPLSSVLGSASSRSVCPVGAVSNTTTSKVNEFTCFRISAKLNASSMPGMLDARSPSTPSVSAFPSSPSIGGFGSTSIANRLSNPSTGLGFPQNFCGEHSRRGGRCVSAWPGGCGRRLRVVPGGMRQTGCAPGRWRSAARCVAPPPAGSQSSSCRWSCPRRPAQGGRFQGEGAAVRFTSRAVITKKYTLPSPFRPQKST